MADKVTREGRLSIVYRPAEDAPEVDLPLRLLFVGDFGGLDDQPPDDRVPVRIERDTFDQVLAAHAPRLDLAVASGPAGEGPAVRGQLVFRSLYDFGPAAVAEQIPHVRRLLQLRDALTALKGSGDTAVFRASLPSLVEDPAARDRLLSALGLEPA